MVELDYHSPVPLYHQLKELMIEQIQSKGMQPGDPIATEAELQQKYQLSRTTVRKALEELEYERIIKRRRGKRSVIARPPIEEFLPRLVGLTEEMSESNRKVHSEVLEAQWLKPPTKIKGLLNLTQDTRVLQMIRVRFIDDEPVFYSTSYFPEELGLSPKDDFSSSLFQLLQHKRGVRVVEADMIVEAVAAKKVEAFHLKIEEGSPLLKTSRVTFSAGGEAVEYLEQLARSDRYRHQVRLKSE